jgi:hypothetical protein
VPAAHEQDVCCAVTCLGLVQVWARPGHGCEVMGRQDRCCNKHHVYNHDLG